MKVRFFLVFTLVTFSLKGQVNAPLQKIGHADWQYIFSRMPEYRQIETELKTFEAQLQNQLKWKKHELETGLRQYSDLPADTPDAIRKDRESQLSFLEENLQNFQQEALRSMQKKQNDLAQPVIAKVGEAIEAVANENGFAYIINPQIIGGGDVLLFADERYDISDLVLHKLGIDVAKSVPPDTKKD
ncbi:MAG TPA: OmpH family outer membrane protein [Chryseosolibacter sp.]|nr:OmpH family outer membrane protein [Chryseosolibacter sp.]